MPIVSRVRFRSTMCVPPWDAGVNPIPPSPASRPECMRMRPMRTIEMSVCQTARTWSIAGRVADVLAAHHVVDRRNEVKADPVLRDIAGGARTTRPVDVEARVRPGQHED